MSYCRIRPGSDVYMFLGGGPGDRDEWVCCTCLLDPDACIDAEYAGPSFATRQEARVHLLAHRVAGHAVPQEAIDRLEREIAEGPKPDELSR